MSVSDKPVAHDSGLFRPDDLASIRRRVAVAARNAGLDENDAQNFTLAVSEAVTNVIEHAHGAGELLVFVQDDQLIADVTDHGPGFTLETPDATPGPRQGRGRGLWLMRRCVDRIELFSWKVSHRLRLVKNIPVALVAGLMRLCAVGLRM